jgi:hypothetical protein
MSGLGLHLADRDIVPVEDWDMSATRRLKCPRHRRYRGRGKELLDTTIG